MSEDSVTQPNPAFDNAIMREGQKLAQGAPPLTVAQVDRVVAALRISSDDNVGQQAA